jgi:hypothetical protein
VPLHKGSNVDDRIEPVQITVFRRFGRQPEVRILIKQFNHRITVIVQSLYLSECLQSDCEIFILRYVGVDNMKEAAATAPNLAINRDTMTDVQNIRNFQAELKMPDDKFYLRF